MRTIVPSFLKNYWRNDRSLQKLRAAATRYKM